jgi:putative endonuclease
VRQSLGDFGEVWAAGYLTRRGYRIIDRKVRFRRGEIDLVAWRGATLVFVEVKCRRTSAYGSPQASITRPRYARLAAAIDSYLQDKDLEPEAFRIDVVAMRLDSDGSVRDVSLIENVEPPAA